LPADQRALPPEPAILAIEPSLPPEPVVAGATPLLLLEHPSTPEAPRSKITTEKIEGPPAMPRIIFTYVEKRAAKRAYASFEKGATAHRRKSD
jgi:hypothetical protein